MFNFLKHGLQSIPKATVPVSAATNSLHHPFVQIGGGWIEHNIGVHQEDVDVEDWLQISQLVDKVPSIFQHNLGEGSSIVKNQFRRPP